MSAGYENNDETVNDVTFWDTGMLMCHCHGRNLDSRI